MPDLTKQVDLTLITTTTDARLDSRQLANITDAETWLNRVTGGK